MIEEDKTERQHRAAGRAGRGPRPGPLGQQGRSVTPDRSVSGQSISPLGREGAKKQARPIGQDAGQSITAAAQRYKTVGQVGGNPSSSMTARSLL